MVGYIQVVYEHSLQTKSHQYQVYNFHWKDGHLVCSSIHHLIMAAFMPHLVTNTKTIAENQWSTAAATFGAGAMKHKEEGYRLFPDDHVWMVGFPPGFATDSHSRFHGIVKPSFKTIESYSTVVP